MANGKNSKGNNKSNGIASKSKQTKQKKTIIAKNAKEFEVNITTKKPVNNKPQMAKKPAVPNKNIKNQSPKVVVAAPKAVTKKPKEVITKKIVEEVKIKEDDSDLEGLDIENSEDDFDESDIDLSDDEDFSDMDTSDMEKLLLDDVNDSEISEIDSEGEIAYNEDDDVESSDEEEAVKTETKPIEKTKTVPVVKPVEIATPKTVVKVETVKNAIDSTTPAGKILNEMTKRKNALSGCSLHMKNVAKDATPELIGNNLKNLVHVHIPSHIRNKVTCNRGYAFARFATATDAATALKTINKLTIGTKKLVATVYQCKRAYVDIDHIDLSRVQLTSSTLTDLLESIKSMFTGAAVTKIDSVTYELKFENKSEAMRLFERGSISIDGAESLQSNFVFDLIDKYDNSVIASAVETAAVAVPKAGMKRGKPDGEEPVVAKKARVEVVRKPVVAKKVESIKKSVVVAVKKEEPVKSMKKAEQKKPELKKKESIKAPQTNPKKNNPIKKERK